MEANCSCKGSLKYAHRTCVQRWCDEKGDTICEICLKLVFVDDKTTIHTKLQGSFQAVSAGKKLHLLQYTMTIMFDGTYTSGGLGED